MTAYCGGDDNCPWRVHASPMPDGVTYKIKTCTPDHTCQACTKIAPSAAWMAEKIKSIVKSDPNVTNEVLRNDLVKYGINPTDMQLWRAKQKAKEMVDGNHAESYKMLPKYCLIVMRTNPGSIAKIHFHMSLGATVPSIKRFFLAFDATKKGFLAGCKPYIGFDGCFLKGPFGGVLLSAIGMDGNSGLLPLAFAVVESENKESWCFFFEWLTELLDGFPADRDWTFMTDRQKVVHNFFRALFNEFVFANLLITVGKLFITFICFLAGSN